MSQTGYSNDQISLEWVKHFERHSAKTSIGSKRLLLLDGHGSHHTKEFIQYCDDHQIIPFGLPPHLTHLLQPLDVVVFQPLKHYHAKALDVMVRDGLTNISKIEFLACIQGVRTQAFKKSTILSAFKKTGIYPFNPLPILQQLQERQAQRTPTPPPSSQGSSSKFSTPVTLRQIHKVASKVTEGLQEEEALDRSTVANIDRFMKGAISLATELIQTKRDLARTRYAEQLARQRRAGKNTQLRTGGVLTVDQGRRMVQQRGEDELAKAQRIVEAAQVKERTARKKYFEAAAKTARHWRLKGRLGESK
ncbi:transposase [Verticillium dahliae]